MLRSTLLDYIKAGVEVWAWNGWEYRQMPDNGLAIAADLCFNGDRFGWGENAYVASAPNGKLRLMVGFD